MNSKKIVSVITSVATVALTTAGAFMPLAAGAQTPTPCIFTPLAIIGSAGSSPGQFDSISDVEVDSAGNVYVVNNSSAAGGGVAKFDSSGNFQMMFGSYGQGAGQFDTPQGVAVDSTGNVYVTDSDTTPLGGFGQFVEKFASDGTFVTSWQLSPAFAVLGIDVGPGDILYVGEGSVGRVFKFDTSGNPLGSFPLPAGSGAWLDVDSASKVYVSLSDHVGVYSSTGTLLDQWGTAGTGNGQFQFARSISLDTAETSLYVTDQNRVQQFSTDGTFITSTSAFAFPVALDAHVAGGLYLVHNNTTVRKLGCVTPTPNPTQTPPPGPANDYLTFALQTIGNGPSSFDPINGALMKVFDTSAPAFTSAYGFGFGAWKDKLNLIYNGSPAPISTCTTVDGACVANKSGPGNYLVIGKFVDTATNKTAYVSKTESPADFDLTQSSYVDLKVQKHFKQGAFDKYGPPGQVIVVDGVASAGGSGNSFALALLALAAGFGVGIYLKGRKTA